MNVEREPGKGVQPRMKSACGLGGAAFYA